MLPNPLRSLAVFVLALAVGAPSGTSAQPMSALSSQAPDSTIQVMMLGTLHFANPGRDVYNPRVGDVTTPERQAQIQAVVDSLLDFRPTKIAVEWVRENATEFDSLYAAYRAGTHEMAPNEREQLGFRLAAQSNHDRIYAVDRKFPFPMDTVMAYAQAHQPSFVQYFQEYGSAMKAKLDSVGQQTTIGEMLRFINTPEWIDFLHAPYLRMPEVDADSTHVGVRPVASYYERNLHIFANLIAVTEPGDRAIIIFGVGHAPFLRSYIKAHPGMTLVEPLDYL